MININENIDLAESLKVNNKDFEKIIFNIEENHNEKNNVDNNTNFNDINLSRFKEKNNNIKDSPNKNEGIQSDWKNILLFLSL